MAENRLTFRVSQKTETASVKRQIDFVIDKGKISGGDTQHITLVITEDDKRILAVSIDKETIVNLNEGTSYKFDIEIDCSMNQSVTRITAEVISHKDFWWFGILEDTFTAYIREKSVELFVSEFVRDLLNFLTSNISVKARQ